MAAPSPLQQQTQGTGTWNISVPINFFAYATYQSADGKRVRMPVGVAGDHTQVMYQETVVPRS